MANSLNAKVRDIYIHGRDTAPFYRIYGFAFTEVLHAITPPLKMLLLLQPKTSAYCSMPTDCGKLYLDFVPEEELADLVKNKDHNRGDFAWIELSSHKDLWYLSQAEVIEILYLAHTYRIYNRARLNRLLDKWRSRFVCLGHDDGWYLKLLCRRTADFSKLLARVIAVKTATLLNRPSVPAPNANLMRRILKTVNHGIYLSFPPIGIKTEGIRIQCIERLGSRDQESFPLNARQKFFEKYTFDLCFRANQWRIE